MAEQQTATQRASRAPDQPGPALIAGGANAQLKQLSAALHEAAPVRQLAAMIQRQPIDEEKMLQGKFAPVQRAVEDEDLVQGRFAAVQRAPEDEELLQGKFAIAQRAGADEEELQLKAAPANNTGLPDGLKSGVEALSGMSMDGVKVHYNSAKPAQLNAHAYAQGTDIHLAPGQSHHLPHEAWHVVQQAQGRVKPTMQMKTGVPVNDDVGLEREADVMGAKAQTLPLHRAVTDDETGQRSPQTVQRVAAPGSAQPVIQRAGVKSELQASDDDFREFMDDTNTIEDTRTEYATSIYNMYKPNPGLGGGRNHFSQKIPNAVVNPDYDNKIALDKAKRLTKWTSTAINAASRIYHELVAATQINDGLGEDYAHITFGQDTDLEADVMTNDTTALEVKRIDSDSQGAVDGHITKVSQQLSKRVEGYNGEEIDTWIAKIKIDSQDNPWPYTPVALAKAVAKGNVDAPATGQSRIEKYEDEDTNVHIRYIVESDNQDIGEFLAET